MVEEWIGVVVSIIVLTVSRGATHRIRHDQCDATQCAAKPVRGLQRDPKRSKACTQIQHSKRSDRTEDLQVTHINGTPREGVSRMSGRVDPPGTRDGGHDCAGRAAVACYVVLSHAVRRLTDLHPTAMPMGMDGELYSR